MERGGCDWQLDFTIRNDLRLLPSSLGIPINGKHMVRIVLTKDIILGIRWLIFLDLSFVNFDVFRVKGSKLDHIRGFKGILRLYFL